MIQESIKLHSNDKLVKFDDGTFKYFDSYGEEINFQSIESLQSWINIERIEIDKETEKWIEKEI